MIAERVRARLADEADFEGWRRQARALLAQRVPPDDVVWTVGDAGDLVAEAPAPPPRDEASVTVSRRFVELAEQAALHRDPERHALLYRLLWRLRAAPALIDDALDPELARVDALARAVRRDRHKMTAFVRFREIPGAEIEWLAWFEPEHHIVAATLPFFVRRFASMRWAILTPHRSGFWDGATLRLGPGARRADAAGEDALDDLWRGYYASIFNPARLKVDAMRAEMPKKYWRNLPEAQVIPSLIATARSRTDAMIARRPAADLFAEAPAAEPALPPAIADADDLATLRERAAGCRACPLWRDATQTVFGEGARRAKIMFVGEQPGDREDLAGKPFVGPAGQLLDRALDEAGIDREATYVTNAVKHFKFVRRGKIRLHQKPGRVEIQACKPWLEREMELVEPALIVALGATAAQALLGRAVTIGRERGRVQEVGQRRVMVTVHPSFLLRLPDEEAKREEYGRFVQDLRRAAKAAD